MLRKAAALMAALILLTLSAAAFAITGDTGAPEDGYVPGRESNLNREWGTYKLESEEQEDVEYQAIYSGGELQQLEVDWVDPSGSGIGCNVVYDRKGHIISAAYEDEEEELYYDGRKWRDKQGKEVQGPDISFMKEYFKEYKADGYWFWDNTMSLIGLYLRELNPDLTDKWYQVVPIDLRTEGTYRYPTAASNLYYLGACDVTIRDGQVTVDYVLPKGEAYPRSHCIMWFTSLSQITTEFLDNPVSEYRFGEPVSIQDKLEGHDIALLFICNHLNYRVPISYDGTVMPTRYFRGRPVVVDMVNKYTALLEEMNTLYPDE